MRDSQRSKVYSAEQHWGIYDKGIRFIAVEECQKWVDSTWKNAKVLVQFPWISLSAQPTVKPGFGAKSARGSRTRLVLPKWARVEGVMIHELAHSICHLEQIKLSKTMPAHGRRFCQIYLGLVEAVLGFDERLALFAAMRERRVNVHGEDK